MSVLLENLVSVLSICLNFFRTVHLYNYKLNTALFSCNVSFSGLVSFSAHYYLTFNATKLYTRADQKVSGHFEYYGNRLWSWIVTR